jgi:hypothetical protein
MDKKEAFEIVYNELIKNPLFCGKFDATNGNRHYMYGICTVMESIAFNVSEDTYNEYSTLWFDNIMKSIEKEN